jgi:hypothetical protein
VPADVSLCPNPTKRLPPPLRTGCLRPIAPVHLNAILELLLNYLVSLGLSHEAAPVDDLTSALADAHDVPQKVLDQVMSWFGTVEDGTWKMDVDAVVAEIGLLSVRPVSTPPLPPTPALFRSREITFATTATSRARRSTTLRLLAFRQIPQRALRSCS